MISATVGEYSDTTTWLVERAFLDKEQALAHVKELDEEGARLKNNLELYTITIDGPVVRGDDMDGKEVALESKIGSLDPKWRTWSSDLPTYTVEALELHVARDYFANVGCNHDMSFRRGDGTCEACESGGFDR